MAAETNASPVHSPPHKDYMDPFISLPNEMINGPEWLKHPLLSEEDVKPVLDDTKRPSAPSSPPEPDPGNVPPPYPHHLDPYYHYYYGPVKKPLDEHQTTSADVQDPVNPHDLHHLHHQPNVAPHNQDPPPAGSQLLSENSRKDLLPHGDSGYVGSPQPQYAPPHSFYPYVAQQPPYDALGRRVGEEGCTVEQHLVLVVPDCVLEPTLDPPAHPSEGSDVSCTLEKLTSDPDIYIVPLDACRVSHVFGQKAVHPLEVHGVHPRQPDQNSPVRLMVECGSSPVSPGGVWLHTMDPPPPPATVTVQLRIATDQSFTSYHPEAHLPLSLLRVRPLYLEVSLLEPPETDLKLLVHSCLAHTHTPFTSWILVYDGCSSRGDAQLLPSRLSELHHIRRIVISSFLSLPSDMAKGGPAHLEDPELYFICLTEVCFAADDHCAVNCNNSPNSEQ
ncbi:zona pellucida sperm-binding protein 1-like [Anabas testudineus]|uniref:zona pellucida sperm-binding protein 1-like n=1 Tax=Anabas testudineus TaxID=64144 RepID=UPI000E4643A1|nr:zona pellucida sperm-binding protein 1-like [Anabas testudineus]